MNRITQPSQRTMARNFAFIILMKDPKNGPILLAMHGQPVWSYLYSKMIPFLTSAGIRVIAPDLPGYGKSDKPASREDYSYQRQVDWMGQWLTENDFSEITFFGQDWGGLIGLRMVAQDPDRFIKISAGNTGLPYNPDVPKEVINEIKAFRASDEKVNHDGDGQTDQANGWQKLIRREIMENTPCA